MKREILDCSYKTGVLKKGSRLLKGGAPPVLGAQRDHYSYSRYDVALIAWFEMACYRCFNSKFQAPQVYASCLPSVKGLLQIPVISPIYVHTHQKSSWGSSAVSQYQYTRWLSWHKGSKTLPLHENKDLIQGCGFKVSNRYLSCHGNAHFIWKFI